MKTNDVKIGDSNCTVLTLLSSQEYDLYKLSVTLDWALHLVVCNHLLYLLYLYGKFSEYFEVKTTDVSGAFLLEEGDEAHENDDDVENECDEEICGDGHIDEVDNQAGRASADQHQPEHVQELIKEQPQVAHFFRWRQSVRSIGRLTIFHHG
jgi:hypothetical protein